MLRLVPNVETTVLPENVKLMETENVTNVLLDSLLMPMIRPVRTATPRMLIALSVVLINVLNVPQNYWPTTVLVSFVTPTVKF